MNRLLIFAVGVLFGAVGAGVTLARIQTQPSMPSAPVAACPPIAAAVRCPAVEVDHESDPTTAAVVEVRPLIPEGPAPTPSSPTDAPTVSAATPAPPADRHNLLIPVLGVVTAQLRDTFSDARGGNRVHDAIDIMAPKGTPVLAAVEGKVVKLFSSVAGGLTLYQFDVGERHAYYYAHLDGYAPGLAEGQLLKRGEVLGFVGYTGNASPSAPHLHFAIVELGPQKRWWQGTALNPYPLLVSGQSP